MFVCDKCLLGYDNARSMRPSRGQCEICGKSEQICNDIPSEDLKPKKVKKFYIAGSWRSINFIRWLWARLDPHTYHDWSAYGFLWKEIPETGAAFIQNKRVRDTFRADVEGIAECDVFALVAPGGNSSHIETGIAFALRKRMVLIGEPSKDCFYNVFDVIYDGGESFLRGEVREAE